MCRWRNDETYHFQSLEYIIKLCSVECPVVWLIYTNTYAFKSNDNVKLIILSDIHTVNKMMDRRRKIWN